jgi:hypothetical protein
VADDNYVKEGSHFKELTQDGMIIVTALGENLASTLPGRWYSPSSMYFVYIIARS